MTNPAHQMTVIGAGLFTPYTPNIDAWIQGDTLEEPVSPEGAIFDRRSKRRASQLMKGLADAYGEAIQQAGISPEEPASVFGSALGEVSTMIGLLDQMWGDHDPPSPMAFANSVHNAASGAVSIGTKNRRFTTSIAADFDTTAAALTEALGLLATKEVDTVIIVVGDEEAPEKLSRKNFDWGYIGAALALTSNKRHPQAIAHLSDLALRPEQHAKTHRASLSEPLARNPQAGMLDLIDAIVQKNHTNVRLDRGRGRGWTVHTTPAAASD